jgi:hypothetical protein
MKINLLLLLCPLLLSITSCKKTYTCTCNTDYTFKNTNGSYTSVVIPANGPAYTEKMKEKKAKAACQHEQTAIQTNFTNGITESGKYPLVTGESIVTKCAITN